MTKYIILILLPFLVSPFVNDCLSQEIIIKGKVTDAQTGEGMPFVTIAVKNNGKGGTTDFDGFYSIKVPIDSDSLVANYIGYATKIKALNNISQNMDFQLSAEENTLEEIVVRPDENPAHRILREVIKNKEKNDKRAFSAYQFESYNKIEISIDNISDKFRQKKVMKKLVAIFDSLKVVSGDDGKPVLPVFVSEAISNYYHRKSPDKTKEEIIATKLTGVGIDNGSLVSQLIGSTFQEYNFYKNWLTIVEKDFISPIADGWNGFYDYELLESTFFNGNYCYKIDVKPKRPLDLAFTGTIWIADTSFALKQIDVSIGKKANINYIDKIKIQQQLSPTPEGPWMPTKSRVLIDIDEIGENSPGMLAKFYTSNKDIVVNAPKDEKFYEDLIKVAEDANGKKEEYWDQHRHDSLTDTEKNVYKMIDSLKNIPVVKTYVEIVNIVVNGYKKMGPVDLGPYVFLYANNNIEGHRFRLGFKTNIDFSNKWIFKGFMAYGTRDRVIKYNGEIQYIISRDPWTLVGIERKVDIDQIALSSENISNYLFAAATKFGTLRGPYLGTENIFHFQTEIRKDLTQKVIFKTKHWDPLYPFNGSSNNQGFSYYENLLGADSTLFSEFNTTEVTLETRITKDEIFIQNDNERISLGTKKWPIFTFRYTYGLKGVLMGDFEFHKVKFNMSHTVKVGVLGRSYYDITAGRNFSPVPYPLLEVHIGNQSPFYTTSAYNLMNYFEFISDSYVSLRYRHYFEGLFFNRIPLVKKLKWRFLASTNILYGSLSKRNKELIPVSDAAGRPRVDFSSLENLPYVEVGYGIENIFKIIRVDAFHRVTYRNRPGANNFGVKVSFQFIL